VGADFVGTFGQTLEEVLLAASVLPRRAAQLIDHHRPDRLTEAIEVHSLQLAVRIGQILLEILVQRLERFLDALLLRFPDSVMYTLANLGLNLKATATATRFVTGWYGLIQFALHVHAASRCLFLLLLLLLLLSYFFSSPAEGLHMLFMEGKLLTEIGKCFIDYRLQVI
jgi:hypothetical protein